MRRPTFLLSILSKTIFVNKHVFQILKNSENLSDEIFQLRSRTSKKNTFLKMAPQKKADIQKGEVVQAVVMADSFDSKFGPLTTTKPRVRSLQMNSNFTIHAIHKT